MVRIEPNKLIIEIHTLSPYEHLLEYQKALVELISVMNFEFIQNMENHLNFVCCLMSQMLIHSDDVAQIANDKSSLKELKKQIRILETEKAA